MAKPLQSAGLTCARKAVTEFEPAMQTVWRVFAYLKRYPWLAAGTLSCAVVGTLMVIIFPAVAKQMIDDVVRLHHPEKLIPLTLLAAGAYLVQHSLNALRILLNNT